MESPDSDRDMSPRSRRRRILAIGGVCVLAILLAFVAYAMYGYFSIQSKIAPPSADRQEIREALDATVTVTPEDTYTYILLLGSDKRPGQTRARSDSIILARLSERDKSVLLLSIPRDTRTEVPGHGTTKINHASAYGGAPLAIQTVKKFTGLPVNHYAEIDFVGFGKVVDLLGGIDMYVDRPVNYGQGITVGVGMQHLNGTKALSVMRNRKAYAQGDFGRIKNQQAFLSAIARAMTAPANISRLPTTISMVAQHVETDLSVGEIVALSRDYRARTDSDFPSYTVPGKTATIGGISYVIADAQKSKALFEAIERGETPPQQ